MTYVLNFLILQGWTDKMSNDTANKDTRNANTTFKQFMFSMLYVTICNIFVNNGEYISKWHNFCCFITIKYAYIKLTYKAKFLYESNTLVRTCSH